MKPEVIAEIGVNHGGSVDAAKELIRAAVDSGADAVKFQTFTAERLASSQTPKVPYQRRDTTSATHFDMLAKLSLDNDALAEVARFAHECGTEFLSTPYTIEAVFDLMTIGVSRFKTASADIVDLPLHDCIADTGLPVLMATGMASDGEIEEALERYPNAQDVVTLMHAVSAYPTPSDKANVQRLVVLSERFGLPIGYSDHTEGWMAAVAATALGAGIIEKHFTLDRHSPGPDHLASSDPSNFSELCKNVRRVAETLGTGQFGLLPEEIDMANVSRKSIHAGKDMPRGTVITEAHLSLLRPGTGLFWRDRHRVVGRTTTRHIRTGETLQVGDVQ